MKSQIALALIAVFIAASPAIIASSAAPSSPLTYSVSILGRLEGGALEWINITGRVTYHVNVRGVDEVALPEPSLVMNYSPGLANVDNAGFSVESLEMKLSSNKEFVINDPFTAALNPLFLLSISDIPAILTGACGGSAVGIESKNTSATAAITTYEDRESLEFIIVFRVKYADGSAAEIMTHSIIDLATLEPLFLENNVSEAFGNCSIGVNLRAELENVDDLPAGRVHEYRVATSRGDAIILVGGAEESSPPILSGEYAVTITVKGEGRIAVIVAHTPSTSPPTILVGNKKVKTQTYLHSLGTVYTLGFLGVEGETAVEVLFGNARVAVPATGTPPSPLITTTSSELTQSTAPLPDMTAGSGTNIYAGVLPYVAGVALALVVGVIVYLILRRE